jgi:hypothetical protein
VICKLMCVASLQKPSGGLVRHGIGQHCLMLCWKSQSDHLVRHGIGLFCPIPCRTRLFDWFLQRGIGQHVRSHVEQPLSDESLTHRTNCSTILKSLKCFERLPSDELKIIGQMLSDTGIGQSCPMLCRTSQSNKSVRHGIRQCCLIPCRTSFSDWLV